MLSVILSMSNTVANPSFQSSPLFIRKSSFNFIGLENLRLWFCALYAENQNTGYRMEKKHSNLEKPLLQNVFFHILNIHQCEKRIVTMSFSTYVYRSRRCREYLSLELQL